MTNTPYQRKFRTYTPDTPPERRREKPRRRRFSLFKTLLMLLGAGCLLVLLMRYVIVPVLVYLPTWLGGAP